MVKFIISGLSVFGKCLAFVCVIGLWVYLVEGGWWEK